MKCEKSSRIRSPYPSFSCERYNICYIWRWQADKLNIRISRICQPCPVSPSPCIAQWNIGGQARLQYLDLNNSTNTNTHKQFCKDKKRAKILTNLKCVALFRIFDSGLAPEPLHYMDIVVHILWRGANYPLCCCSAAASALEWALICQMNYYYFPASPAQHQPAVTSAQMGLFQPATFSSQQIVM